MKTILKLTELELELEESCSLEEQNSLIGGGDEFCFCGKCYPIDGGAAFTLGMNLFLPPEKPTD